MAVLNMAPITGAGEGWMISSSVAKANNLKTVSDVLARPDLFPHPEDAKKGGLVTCPSGWGCQIATGQLFKAFGMEDKGWQMVDPGSSAGLDGSIEKGGHPSGSLVRLLLGPDSSGLQGWLDAA